MSSTPPPSVPGIEPADHFNAAANLWIHLDQTRHMALYNYLMATTILLLAWATIFAANGKHRLVLITLAMAGILLSLVWVAYGHRANRHVTQAEEVALAFEGPGGPFSKRKEARTEMPIPGKLANSKYVIPGVPILFAVVYTFLLIVVFLMK